MFDGASIARVVRESATDTGNRQSPLPDVSADHVLVAVDGSTQSVDAIDYVFAQYKDGKLTILHAVEPVSAYMVGSGQYFSAPPVGEFEAGEPLCADARDRAAMAGVLTTIDLETITEVGSPVRTIVSYAEDHSVDHILMGSHGRTGLSRILFGSVAEAVTRRVSVPVTIVH